MSCHWTTPQGRGISSHAAPRASIAGRAQGLISQNTCNDSPVYKFCNHACTLPWGASSRPAIGALVSAALLWCACAPGPDAAVATTPSSGCPNANLAPSTANTAIVDAATLCLIDRLRTAHRLHPLRFNHALQLVAARQASYMVRGHYFADNSPSGRTPLNRILASHYPAHAASVSLLTAQNIAWGIGPSATPASIVRAWMESPPHRQIILTGAYRDAGVGVAPAAPSLLERGQRGATYVVEFGARAR